MIVLDDADLDGAVEVALASGFGGCGQGPGSVARVLVQRKVSQSFTDRLVASAAAFRTADPSSPGTQMGPLLTRDRRRKALDLIESARRAGGRVATGGDVPPDAGAGWFLLPTVLVDMRPSMPMAADHRPGPIVSVVVVDSLEEAIHVLNHALPGLSSSVHTRDVGRVHRVLRDLETPDIVLNGPPAAAGGAMVLPTGAAVGSADESAWILAMSESRTAVLTAGARQSAPPPEFD
jgi:acyl-CoA reductase-like NAD-dependent aldehyde dehydrogenase